MELHYSAEQEAPEQVTKLFLNVPLAQTTIKIRLADRFFILPALACKIARDLRHDRLATYTTAAPPRVVKCDLAAHPRLPSSSSPPR